MSKSSAKAWPYGIALSFVGIIAMIIGTIVVASNNAVEPSDLYMRNYHDVDANANAIIYKKIAFDKKYALEYAGVSFTGANAAVGFRITDMSGAPVTNAKIDVTLTRPNTRAMDIVLNFDGVTENGEYRFVPVELPKEGRWNIMASVSVGDEQRYYNLKADTRYPEMTEY